MVDLLKPLFQKIVSNPEALLRSIGLIIGIILLAAAGWWLFNRSIRKIQQHYEDRPFFRNNPGVFTFFKRAGNYTILILAGVELVSLFRVPLVERLFLAFMILLFTAITNTILKTVLAYLERNLAARTQTEIDDVIIELTEHFSGVVVYAIGIVLALDVVGLNIMPFVAGASVAGIAIGFAAKDTLSNLIAGVLLIIDRPFELGDRVEVWSAPKNSATWGDVVEIGIRATKIRTTDNIMVVIPNNEIMTRDIINYTTGTNAIRVRIPIGVSYDADIDKAKEAIIKICLELDWVLPEPAPKVVVRNFADSAINLEARVWISEPRRRMDTISHITDRVKSEYQKAGIEIPYPKRDITIKREA